MDTPIHDFLEHYSKSGAVRCHMPGGKGREYPSDITEIDGADVLCESSGIILESEKNAARLFGAAQTCYSCGGSTLCIQAMLAAVLSLTGRRRITAARFCHKSLVASAVLLGFDTDWVYPQDFPGCKVAPEDIEAAIGEDTAAVFVQSVDYYGGQADIPAIAAVCRRRGVPLLVDNAHGAYKVFTHDHPITLGADMTADSAHKTLPALTGTAYLHMSDEKYHSAAKSAMSLFGSSSPSYLMLESLDLCNRFIADETQTALTAIDDIKRLKEKLRAAGFAVQDSDAMRITLDTRKMGCTGEDYAGLLRENGVECELCDSSHVVLLFSVITTRPELDRVFSAISTIGTEKPLPPYEVSVVRPKKVMQPRQAYFSPGVTVSVSDAVGRICAAIVCPCPPCVPVVMPGELIDTQTADILLHFGISRIRVCEI